MSGRERLKSVAVVGAWAALVWIAYRREDNRRRKRGSEETDRSACLKTKKRWKDILTAFTVENGAVWIATLLRLKIFGARAAQKTWMAKMVNMIGSAIFVDRSLQLSARAASQYIYRDIPHFSVKRTPKQSMWEATKEFFNMTVVSSVLVSAFIVYFRIGEKRNGRPLSNWSLRNDLKRFDLVTFLGKLALTRTVVDALFWIGHKVIHTKRLYAPIHKYHHEHGNPRITTNQHFTIADFWIEALLPIIAGVASVQSTFAVVSPFEEALLGAYIVWLEACSHAGKPLPCSSMLAPLAPVYNELLGMDWDRRNVEFHQTHHEILNCNFSITQWPDNLFGTTKWERSKRRAKRR